MKKSPLAFDVEVELVQIAVRVTDRDGNWITGIRKTDLQLFEEGVQQEILYIDEINMQAAAETATPDVGTVGERRSVSPDTQAPNKVIIIFDGCNSSLISIEKHRTYVRDFLANFQAPQTKFSIILIKPSGDFEIAQNFTSEKELLLKAVDSIYGGMAGIESRTMKAARLSDTTQIEQCAAMRAFGATSSFCNEEALRSIINKATMFAAEEQLRTSQTLHALEKLFAFAGQMPGKKSVLLVSEGLDPGGAFYYNYAANVIDYFIFRYALEGPLRNVFSEAKLVVGHTGTTVDKIRQLIRTANSSDLTVYWINPDYGNRGGDVSVDLSGPSRFGFKYFNAPDIDMTMRGLAEDTGGTALSSFDSEAFYRRMLENIPRYYLVSYKPPRPANDGKFHRIDIKTNNKQYELTYKKDFKDLSAEDRILGRIAEAHDFPETASGLRILTEINYFKNPDDEYHLMMRVGIPYEEITPRIEGRQVTDDIHFSFIVRDEAGKVLFNKHPVIQVRSNYDQFQALQKDMSFLEYLQNCNLKPGRYELSLVAMDSAGSRTASEFIPLELPENKGTCLSISPAMLASAVEKSSTPAKLPTPTQEGKILYGANAFRFGVAKIFPEEGALTGFYQIYNSNVPSVFVRFRLYRDHIFINETSEHEIKAYTDSNQKLITNFFSVPYKNLPLGSYEFEISAREGDGSCEAHTRVAFEVAPSSKDEG